MPIGSENNQPPGKIVENINPTRLLVTMYIIVISTGLNVYCMTPVYHLNENDLKVYQIAPAGDVKFEFPAHYSSEITIKLFSQSHELLYLMKDFEIRQKGNSIIISFNEIQNLTGDILRYEVTAGNLTLSGELKLKLN